MTFHRVASLALAAAASFTALSASAAIVSVNGSTLGAPTWNRPLAGNPPAPPTSGLATATPYEVKAFTIDVAGSYSLLSTATAPVGWDNYTFLYQTAFDPLSPFANVLVGNDDNPTLGVSGFTRTLSTGVNYFFVTTGFNNADSGAYTLTVDGAGTATFGTPAAVPEPATLALAALALAGLGAARRRRAA